MSASTRKPLVFEIVVQPTGDRAEADSPEAARLAARTLLREATEQGCGRPTATFTYNGALVRERVERSEV